MQHAARACCILAPCPNRGSSHDSLRNKASQRICMLCAKACIFHFYSAVPLGRPIGHLCSFSSFSSNSGYDAPVVCPQSLQSIVAIATGVLRGMGYLRRERAHPVGCLPPISIFRGGPRHPFSRVRSIYETRFFSHNFFGRPSGFVESDTTASRNFEFRDVVVSDSTKPDGHRARFVVLLGSTKRV